MEKFTYSFDAAERSQSGSKSHSVNHFDAILRRYRTLYAKSWADRSTAVKNKALERAITEKATADYTRDTFLQEFARRVDLLIDSNHFCDAVEDLVPPLVPYNVATHIVLLGWKELENVLLHGGYKDLRPYEEWKTPVIEYKELEVYMEFQPKGLLEDKSQQVVA